MITRTTQKTVLFLGICLLVLGVFLVTPGDVSAQGCNPSEKLCNPLQFDSLGDFVAAFVRTARDVGILVAVVGLVYAGFLKVTALGDEEKLKKANKAFLWGVIGTAIMLGAWVIALAIQGTVNELEGGESSVGHSVVIEHNFTIV